MVRELADLIFHGRQFFFQLVFVSLQAFSLDVDDVREAADQSDEGIELLACPLDMAGGRSNLVSEISDTSLESEEPLGEEVACFRMFRHDERRYQRGC